MRSDHYWDLNPKLLHASQSLYQHGYKAVQEAVVF